MSKWCAKCKTYKPGESFHKNKSRKDGLHHTCKTCHYNGIKKYRSTIKGKKTRRREHLKYCYEITVHDYDRLFKEQDGKCAICRKEEKLFVDHCHNTGRIRGLLCLKCNSDLASIEDENFRDNAIKYLNKEGIVIAPSYKQGVLPIAV